MNQTETGMLLTKISTYDNRSLTPEIIMSWHEALDPSITIEDARRIVVDFYADPKWVDKRRWIMPADINAGAIRLRNARKPTEAQVNRECSTLGLDASQSWEYRKQRMLGRSAQESRHSALESSRLLPASKPKRVPRGRGVGSFAGSSLSAVLDNVHER